LSLSGEAGDIPYSINKYNDIYGLDITSYPTVFFARRPQIIKVFKEPHRGWFSQNFSMSGASKTPEYSGQFGTYRISRYSDDVVVVIYKRS
jgi:hypothetical protein